MKSRVLVIDDEAAIRDSLRMILEYEDYQFVGAASGQEALDVVSRVGPRRAYTTHMTHDLGHAATAARLPPGVELAYDGLVLDVRVDVR